MTTNEPFTEVSYRTLYGDLIGACKRGDQKAQFQIYKLYYKAMYNTSLRIVKNTAEAEDIMQESFLNAFEKIRTWSGTVSFGAWLKKIVQNKSVDYLRRNRNLVFEDIDTIREVEVNYPDIVPLDNEPGPGISRIMEIIKQLPSKCRRIFSLYVLEGYDHDEISEILSISSGSSRSQLSRARGKIIAALKCKC